MVLPATASLYQPTVHGSSGEGYLQRIPPHMMYGPPFLSHPYADEKCRLQLYMIPDVLIAQFRRTYEETPGEQRHS